MSYAGKEGMNEIYLDVCGRPCWKGVENGDPPPEEQPNR